ncbi:MAG: diguanylate cyclase [Deltaproteobacteria bacterium]|nr:diguanylate cyclase [Deltaproteobacteria bacterium]
MEKIIINKWNGEFKFQEHENLYLAAKNNLIPNRIRVALLLTSLAYLGGIFSDYGALNWSAPFYLMVALRIATFLAAFWCIFATYSSKLRRYIDPFVLFYFIMLTIGECTELVLKPYLVTSLPFLAMIILVYYLFFPTKLIYTVFGGILGSLAYSYMMFRIREAIFDQASPILLNFVLVNLFGIYFVRTMNRTQRTEFWVLEEEKRLNEQLEREIIERKNAEEKYKNLSRIDELTNVYNRRYFFELAERELLRAERNKQSVVMIMIDADNFKSINDTHGHDVGDMVLRTLARICTDNLRSIDVFGRLGGEEFAALLTETSPSQARSVADRIRQLVESTPLVLERATIRVTISLGLAVSSSQATDLESLMKLADQALYRAKHEGRNRVVVFGEEKTDDEFHG